MLAIRCRTCGPQKLVGDRRGMEKKAEPFECHLDFVSLLLVRVMGCLPLAEDVWEEVDREKYG